MPHHQRLQKKDETESHQISDSMSRLIVTNMRRLLEIVDKVLHEDKHKTCICMCNKEQLKAVVLWHPVTPSDDKLPYTEY